MSKPLSRKYVEEYDSDNGFVEDAPKSKKHKSEPKQRKSDMQKDDEGNEYWEISGRRRVQVSQFKNNTFVGVREFYEQGGKMLPGKKGISMSIEQYTAFINLLPDIERALKTRGISVPRPQYDQKLTQRDDDEEDDDVEGAADEDEEEEEEEQASSKRKEKAGRAKMRKNHEATSDEDED